jgi:FAD/FMN-containing dehydrogenase
MIAADVHGKNHHLAGTFGRHVERLTLLTADGGLRVCTPGTDGLLEATTGGMGLTGVILEAIFRLVPIETAFIRQESLRARDFDAALACCEASAGWTYSVAWIDCLARGRGLGRALVYRGEHATRHEVGDTRLAVPRRRVLRLPADLPPWLLNRWSVRAFNELYYRGGRGGSRIVDYDGYFYPLDALLDWNRLYGRAGFMQYQCVLPKPASSAGIRQILRRVADAGSGSFLAVLKLFGPQGAGLLSFPMEGYTLTLDFPVNQDNLRLACTLDAIVADHGGRLYLAKDARADPAMLRAGYPRLAAFAAIRDRVDPARRFRSVQSERLGL